MFPMLDVLCVSACPLLRLKRCPPTFCGWKIEATYQVISSLEEVGSNIGHLASSIPYTARMDGRTTYLG
jgi:hypothetical protein